MKKEHQKELVIAICFFLLGSCLMFPIEKKRKLDKIKHDKIIEIIWDSYQWKTERLRIYTDLVYRND
tara:strand:- start:7586 stop:7786 length:201 start_codon:yes stop_codon:yes gene_type:complete